MGWSASHPQTSPDIPRFSRFQTANAPHLVSACPPAPLTATQILVPTKLALERINALIPCLILPYPETARHWPQERQVPLPIREHCTRGPSSRGPRAARCPSAIKTFGARPPSSLCSTWPRNAWRIAGSSSSCRLGAPPRCLARRKFGARGQGSASKRRYHSSRTLGATDCRARTPCRSRLGVHSWLRG